MQTRSSGANLEPINLEIERACRVNRRNRRMAGNHNEQQDRIRNLEAELERLRQERAAPAAPQQNQDNVAMTDLLAPHRPRNRAGVVLPAIQANNFELKSSMIQMVQGYGQFSGGIQENPSEHLDRFLMV